MTTRQPFLHDLLATVQAPTQAWAGSDGQVRDDGAQGVYHGDVRVLAEAVVRVGGAEPEAVSAAAVGAGRTHVVSLVRAVDGPGADPTARLDRRRHVRAGALDEQLTISCSTAQPVRARVEVHLQTDATPMARVKEGHRATPVAFDGSSDPLRWHSGVDLAVVVEAPGARLTFDPDRGSAVLAWDVEAVTGSPATVSWGLAVTDSGGVVSAPHGTTPEWARPVVVADDRRLAALLERAFDDLSGLRMSAAFSPDDVFVAAGAPWFLTLFGRDSIWAARMLLPLGTDLAGGTLRTLAARQGVAVDRETAEQPGKILHEVRRVPLVLPGEGLALPPLYYGTVDATPLWVCLLHDAWRWGMPPAEVEALLPAAEAALAWMVEHGDPDGDGFLEYVDETGYGLANQGWKDSGDSVQWRDGRLATGPIALCEVQGYAYEAAIGGAELLEAFGRPGGARWRQWAAGLAVRFRESFWVRTPEGSYPGIALDRDKAVVDTLTSNIGHLLGTGLLDADEERAVAARLGSPQMDSGRGLRTMSSASAGYWPLRYHGGAVWPHDTAVAVAGLARGGFMTEAASLVDGFLGAGADFEDRMPELWSGDARADAARTVPYPAACRPQAWSAASSVAVLSAVLGLRPDVPGGSLQVRPLRPSPLGAIDVRGLRLGGHPLDVSVRSSGESRVTTAAPVQVV